MRQLRAAAVLFVFLLSCALLMPVQWTFLRTSPRLARTFPHLFHRYVARLFGIRLDVRGRPLRDTGVLIAANHTSWLDIVVLSAALPLSFVAKSEINSWTFFGSLARLQRSLFVVRERRARTAEHRNEIGERILSGDAMVLFPEGTSSDGNRVLKFNSSLFGAAETAAGEKPIPVQPLSVAYTRLHGIPMGREYRPFFAWYGDMALVPHLWQALVQGPIDAVLEFHPPLTVAEAGSRKELCRRAERLVGDGVARALAGRLEAQDVKQTRPAA